MISDVRYIELSKEVYFLFMEVDNIIYFLCMEVVWSTNLIIIFFIGKLFDQWCMSSSVTAQPHGKEGKPNSPIKWLDNFQGMLPLYGRPCASE